MTRRVIDTPKKRTAKTKSPKRDPVSKAKTEDVEMTDPKLTMEVPAGEVPAGVKEFAEKTIEQAEKGFDAFIEAASKSVAMMPNPTTEISKKALSIAEQNMKSAFDHARRLLHAKDMQEAVQIQTDYVKAQYAAVTERLKEMGSSVRSSAQEVSKTTIPNE